MRMRRVPLHPLPTFHPGGGFYTLPARAERIREGKKRPWDVVRTPVKLPARPLDMVPGDHRG